MSVIGVPIVGALPPVGIFREADVPVALPLADLLAGADAWHCSLVAAAPPPEEQAAIVFDKTVKEQELGVVGEFHDKAFFDDLYGLGHWCALRRFALWQENHQAWRVIDNGKESGHNPASGAGERIHTATSEIGFAVAQKLQRLSLERTGGFAALRRGTRDMKRAYRQCAILGAHQRFSTGGGGSGFPLSTSMTTLS